MKAIIVAGGKGERLKPITNSIPKPMMKVAGKPILLHIIELLKKNEVKDFIISLCFLPEVITHFFGDGKKFGVKIEYTFENPNYPLGTAGAITLARKLIKNSFIVTYADILRKLDIKKMLAFHKKNKTIATINIYKRRAKNAKSVIIMDENKKIIQFIERPKDKQLTGNYIWVNGSFYIFEPEIFNFIPCNKKLDFGLDIFPKLLDFKKEIFAFPTEEYFADIGDIKKLNKAKLAFSKV